MNINQLISKLESQITLKLEEMSKMGAEAKRMQQKVDAQYVKMADFWATELKPAETFVRTQNPHLAELFDSLEKLYNDQKASCFCGNPESHHTDCPVAKKESE